MSKSAVKLLWVIFLVGFLLPDAAVFGGPKIDKAKIKLDVERTPQFQDSRYGSSGSGDSWLAVRVEFELSGDKDEWVDEAEMSYKLLIPRKNGRLVMLEQTIKVIDLKCGKKLNSVVYVRPSFIEKVCGSTRPDLGKTSVYVDFRASGQLLHADPITIDGSGMPRGWFKLKELSKVKKYLNDISPRSKTPFAVLDYDYYVSEKAD
ncbi:MAG: Amuc_1102 family pilus-like protein [Lentisphaeria bacterium]